MEIFEKLKEIGTTNPFEGSSFPTQKSIDELEKKLNIILPNSYKEYLLKYSNIYYGGFELYKPLFDNSRLDMVKGIEEATKYHNIAQNLIPFLFDNGDYYCFNINKNAPDYEVVFWSHNGHTNEKWKNFLDWVEKCWIGEHENTDNSMLNDMLKNLGLDF